MPNASDAIADGLKMYSDPANFVRFMSQQYLAAGESERTEIAFALLMEIAAREILSRSGDRP